MKYLSNQFPVKVPQKGEVKIYGLYEKERLVLSGVPYAILQNKKKEMITQGIKEEVLAIRNLK